MSENCVANTERLRNTAINPSPKGTSIPYFTYFSLYPQNPNPPPSPISSGARKSHSSPPCLHTGRISAFMTRQSKWISREVGFSNFRPQHANSHRIFTLTTGFGVERWNLLVWSDGGCPAQNADASILMVIK
ncbi:hypothetical protein AVEN_184246-1 [Araneus ventricosus]|uniref:Uncharacterized protein n=1 Tax=Araneus ventricosus TaxID=182803 RepID=A0A4Y2P8H4_ARAVE|nr:hypothetical protein AVEN_184246-1 [Araneus ventricosus]